MVRSRTHNPEVEGSSPSPATKTSTYYLVSIIFFYKILPITNFLCYNYKDKGVNMNYIFTFLEGIASFISPCILPMLPIYISYFIGKEEKNVEQAAINATGFVIGFTTIFLISFGI